MSVPRAEGYEYAITKLRQGERKEGERREAEGNGENSGGSIDWHRRRVCRVQGHAHLSEYDQETVLQSNGVHLLLQTD